MAQLHWFSRNYKKAYKKVMGERAGKVKSTQDERIQMEILYEEYERRSQEYQNKLARTHISNWPTLQLMNMVKRREFSSDSIAIQYIRDYVMELESRGYVVGWRAGEYYVFIDVAKAGSEKARYLHPVRLWD